MSSGKNIALLDALEEMGIGSEVRVLLRRGLALDPLERTCDCDPRSIAITNSRPHTRTCSLWPVIHAFGLTPEVVARDHGTAIKAEYTYRSRVKGLERGSRYYGDLDSTDETMGRDERHPKSLRYLRARAEDADRLRAAFAERAGRPLTEQESSLFGIDAGTYATWRGERLPGPGVRVNPRLMELLRGATTAPGLNDVIINAAHGSIRVIPDARLGPNEMVMLGQYDEARARAIEQSMRQLVGGLEVKRQRLNETLMYAPEVVPEGFRREYEGEFPEEDEDGET